MKLNLLANLGADLDAQLLWKLLYNCQAQTESSLSSDRRAIEIMENLQKNAARGRFPTATDVTKEVMKDCRNHIHELYYNLDPRFNHELNDGKLPKGKGKGKGKHS